MATVVLVHGIDQQQESADTLETEWLPAVAGGVRAAGFPDIADRIWRTRAVPNGIETRMAFYGHLFLQRGQMGDDPGDFTAAEEAFAEGIAVEWLTRAASRSSRPHDQATAARELAYLRYEIGQEEMGLGEIVRKAIRSTARISWFAPYGMGFAERFVKRALAQVTRYLNDSSTRRAACQAVSSLIGPGTKVVIGHSLGSVVAYEVVRQLAQPLPLFLTLGSPLGLQTIIYHKLEPQPPGFPPMVKRWVNVADPDDYIAAEPDLTTMFSGGLPPGATFHGGYTVDNGAEPHKAGFYLTKPEVGLPIGQTLAE
jgi:hypothetical protein